MNSKYWKTYLSVIILLWASSAVATNELDLISQLHDPVAVHCEQQVINGFNDEFERFVYTFECGDELFDTRFNALDGGGANVGDGGRFTGVPRADLDVAGGWPNHFPERATGPNAESCAICHNDPPTGAGAAGLNVIRDPTHSADPSFFIQRNTPSLLGTGPLQLLAEEMTASLQSLRDRARVAACNSQRFVRIRLRTKNVSYGEARIACDPSSDNYRFIRGIDPDLVVKPFGWKGTVASLREFNRDASHNELGMQAVELVGTDQDGDFDGVSDELQVGDMTAFAIYIAGQARPVTTLELAEVGVTEVSQQERSSINRGNQLFRAIGCANCHRPDLRLNNTVFNEPSENENFREDVFPSGMDPISEGVDPQNPVSFDLAADVLDNQFEFNGEITRLGNLDRDSSDRGIVRLFSDLKRHEMGAELAESINDAGISASVWMTKELWGVGSTAPYLHDGRATTLTEAILAHGGESRFSRNRFRSLSRSRQSDIIGFLNSLVLIKVEPE